MRRILRKSKFSNNQTKRHREVNRITYNDIPSSRIPYIAEALKEVELMEKGLKPSRTAREFIAELVSDYM